MQKWEYYRILIEYINGIVKVVANGVEIFDYYGKNKGQKFNIIDYLANLGADGWELVTSSTIDRSEWLYFKRPIE